MTQYGAHGLSRVHLGAYNGLAEYMGLVKCLNGFELRKIRSRDQLGERRWKWCVKRL